MAAILSSLPFSFLHYRFVLTFRVTAPLKSHLEKFHRRIGTNHHFQFP